MVLHQVNVYLISLSITITCLLENVWISIYWQLIWLYTCIILTSGLNLGGFPKWRIQFNLAPNRKITSAWDKALRTKVYISIRDINVTSTINSYWPKTKWIFLNSPADEVWGKQLFRCNIAQTGASQFCCKFIVLLAPFCFYRFVHFYQIEISSQSPLEFNRFI